MEQELRDTLNDKFKLAYKNKFKPTLSKSYVNEALDIMYENRDCIERHEYDRFFEILSDKSILEEEVISELYSKKLNEIFPQVDLTKELLKFKHTNATVPELRSAMFLPYKKIKRTKVWKEYEKNSGKLTIENQWYKITFRNGLLTQRHRDLLDALFNNGMKVRGSDVKEYYVEFHLNQLGNDMYSESESNDINLIKNLLEDLKNITIKVERKFDTKYKESLYSFINTIHYSNTKRKNVKNIVKFNTDYIEEFHKEISIGYKNELEKILKIKSDLLKSVIRYFLSHKNPHNIKIDKLLEMQTINKMTMAKSSYSKLKSQILDNEVLLNEFNIKVNGDNLSYTPLSSLSISGNIEA